MQEYSLLVGGHKRRTTRGLRFLCQRGQVFVLVFMFLVYLVLFFILVVSTSAIN